MRGSRDTGHYTTTTNTALFVTAAVIVFCIAAAIGAATFVDDAEQRTIYVVMLLGQIPVTAGLLRVLVIADKVDAKADTIHEKTEHIEEKTEQVLNGTMDEKLKQAARDVIEERWGPPPPITYRRPPEPRT